MSCATQLHCTASPIYSLLYLASGAYPRANFIYSLLYLASRALLKPAALRKDLLHPPESQPHPPPRSTHCRASCIYSYYTWSLAPIPEPATSGTLWIHPRASFIQALFYPALPQSQLQLEPFLPSPWCPPKPAALGTP